MSDCAVRIDLKEVRVVGNEEKAIVDALNSLRHRYTYVFTTGGIGPTHGDITADCVAKEVCRSTLIRARSPSCTNGCRRPAPDERVTPAHDAHPQGRGAHPQQGVGGGLASGSAM
jgi:hypothetical protein